MQNKKYQNVSVWFNQYGTDVMYVTECDCEFNQKFLTENSKELKWLEGIKVEDFSEEERGDGWVMYGYDGIGVLCSDVSVEEAHTEYESLCD